MSIAVDLRLAGWRHGTEDGKMSADDGPESNAGAYIAIEFALARKAARQQKNRTAESTPPVDQSSPDEHIADEAGGDLTQMPEPET